MRKTRIIASTVAAGILLTACGSSGSSSETTNPGGDKSTCEVIVPLLQRSAALYTSEAEKSPLVRQRIKNRSEAVAAAERSSSSVSSDLKPVLDQFIETERPVVDAGQSYLDSNGSISSLALALSASQSPEQQLIDFCATVK